MIGGSPQFLFVFCGQTNIVKFHLFINADAFINKKDKSAYMQAINTYVYMQQPGYRSCVKTKCADPPNSRPTPRQQNYYIMSIIITLILAMVTIKYPHAHAIKLCIILNISKKRKPQTKYVLYLPFGLKCGLLVLIVYVITYNIHVYGVNQYQQCTVTSKT